MLVCYGSRFIVDKGRSQDTDEEFHSQCSLQLGENEERNSIFRHLRYIQGCSGAGTRGNGVPIPFLAAGTRSQTFLYLEIEEYVKMKTK